MSGRLEGPQICESIYNLREALRDHKKAELSDVFRYSYLLSIQTYIEAEQAKDYGRCEESDARQSLTFCVDYFEWP
jgi:hypothetical protein